MKKLSVFRLSIFWSVFLAIFSVLLLGFQNPVQAQHDLANDTTVLVSADSVVSAAMDFEEEIIPVLNKDTVRNRLNRIESSIPLSFNKTIYSFIHYFTIRNREYSKMVLRRKELYFPTFEKYLKEHQMPDELKYLAIVESGLNPKAKSKAGAVGLWQFVPGTGRDFKMNIDWYIDERHDDQISTIAACKYLKVLHNMFNDWELALAAYNCGPGNVRKAIRRSRNRRDFWEIYNYLPRETRSYVPQFISIMYMMKYHKEHFLYPEYNEVLMMHDTLWVNQYVNLERLAGQIQVCVDDIQKLNPTLTRNIAPGHIRYFPLKLPADRMHYIRANLCSILDSCSQTLDKSEIVVVTNPHSDQSKTKVSLYHTVKRGEGLQKIAKKYGVSTSQLRAWNDMSNDHIKVGQKLLMIKQRTVRDIPTYAREKNKKDKKHKSKSSSVTSKSKPKFYHVQTGDTLWSIAQKYENLTVDKIKKLNKMRGNEVKVGQILIIG